MKYVLIFSILLFNLTFGYADSLKIIFLGDTHFGENYQLNPKFNRGVNVIKEHGYDYFFENIKELLLSSDLSIANLETPLSNDTVIISTIPGEYIHFSNPDSAPFYLSKYNILAVSIANNHILDLGFIGLTSTLAALNNYAITPFGAGFTEEEASKPFNKKFAIGEKEFEIYIFGGYWYRAKFDREKNYYAKSDKGGVNMLSPVKISEEIKKIKQSNPDAFIVVYPHWGSNYKKENEYQVKTAHDLIEGGVDLIIGTGAHTIQGIENYNGKWIIYNIGNFIFNAPGRYESTNAKPFGLISELVVNGISKILRLYPVYTNNLETNYLVRYLDEDEFENCYDVIAGSDGVQSKIKKTGYKYFEIKIN